MKGNVIHFAQQVEEIYEQLPLTMSQTNNIIVNESLDKLDKIKELFIRPNLIYTALRWLIKNNYLYANVQIYQRDPTSYDINDNIIQSLRNFNKINDKKSFYDQVNQSIDIAESNKISNSYSLNDSILSEISQNISTDNDSQIVNTQTTNYHCIDSIISIIRSDFNQGMHIFHEYSRGKQCSAMCAYAIAALNVINISHWDTMLLNQVILTGDEYYNDCQDRLTLARLQHHNQNCRRGYR